MGLEKASYCRGQDILIDVPYLYVAVYSIMLNPFSQIVGEEFYIMEEEDKDDIRYD